LQFSVSSAKLFGVEDRNCASSQKFRSVRSAFGCEAIQSRDKIVIQLHQYLASSHEPYGNTYAWTPPQSALKSASEVDGIGNPVLRSGSSGETQRAHFEDSTRQAGTLAKPEMRASGE
jgi:hypothetical protein